MKKRGHFSFMNATIASKDKIKSPNKKFKRSLSLPLGNIKYSRFFFIYFLLIFF